MHTIKYTFQPHGDDRGQLVALEELRIFHIESNGFITCMILYLM